MLGSLFGHEVNECYICILDISIRERLICSIVTGEEVFNLPSGGRDDENYTEEIHFQ